MKQNNTEIIFLGSGTCLPAFDRNPPGIVVKIDSQILLLDSGSGTLNRLLYAGIDYRKINYLCYTHTHADHVADLVPILQAMYISPEFDRAEPLYVLGPAQFSTFMRQLANAFGDWIINPGYELRIEEMLHQSLNFPAGKITTAPMKHSRPSIGYRIDTIHKQVITYSGDTDYCPEIIKLALDSDILILECSFPDDQKLEGHLTPTLAAKIAAEANCKHLILTHFYPVFDNVDIISICRETYKGKITLAYDMMKINLP